LGASYDPKLIPPDAETRGEIGPGNFRDVGESFLVLFREVGGLKPTHAVLDVGSGSGRMAAPLTTYLEPPGGRYEGFDVTPPGVKWCQEAYRRFPNFHFQRALIKSDFYGVDGVSPEEFQFPYDAGVFDFVFLTSIFSHLPPRVVEHYMDEIVRMLKRKGTCFITYYMVNLDVLKESRHSKDGIKLFSVGRHSPVWVADRDNPDAVTGYEEDYVFKLYKDRRLVIDSVDRGWWPTGYVTPEAKTMQDIVVAHKR
jgi:SAM-dependent methyltransferase